MKVVVTGGTGFIGSHLVSALLRRGHDVSTISRRAVPDVGALHHSCDVESSQARSAAQNAEVLVHLAGQPDASASLADPALFVRVHSSGTVNMLEAARKSGALFLLASSQRVYRPRPGVLSEGDPLDPSDPYGYAKLVAEKWVEMYQKLYGLRAVVLRFFSVYGPGQAMGTGSSGVVSIFMHRALAGEKLVVNNSNMRDFTYITDVVKAILLCMDRPQAQGETFNAASGTGTSVRDLALLIREISGSSSEIQVQGDSKDECLVANIDKIRQALGYQPEVRLRQGLEYYYESLQGGGRGATEGQADPATTVR